MPVDELAQAVSEEYGGFYDWVVDTASVDGKWYSVPHGNSSSAFAYRISLVEEAGIEDPKNNFPTTYEEFFALGKTLKEMGKPFGQALGHSQGDPPAFAYPFMWAHGAMEVEEDGTTVAINKPEFVEALQAFTQHWKDAYDETGLSWDDGANNRAFLSDQISGTLNGSSVYIAAVNAKEGESTLDYEVQVEPDDIWHAGFPEGPAGRFNALGSRSFAAMSYSPNAEVGRGVPAALLHAGGLHPLARVAGRLHHPDGAGLRRSGDLHGQPSPCPLPGGVGVQPRQGIRRPVESEGRRGRRALRHRRYDRAGDPVRRRGGRRAAGRGPVAAHLRGLTASRHSAWLPRIRGSQAPTPAFSVAHPGESTSPRSSP